MPHILNASKRPVELIQLDTEVVVKTDGPSVVVKSRESASPLVTRATRAFFAMESRRGDVLAPGAPFGPAPAVFREATSGLLRVAYREAVVRFRAELGGGEVRGVLGRYGLEVRAENRRVPNQFVVYDPSRRVFGAELVHLSARLAEEPSVIFAVPNFISEFKRAAPPAPHAKQWHLRNNAALAGQVGGEDVRATAAWAVTTGDAKVVVAILDDGVDIDHPALALNVYCPNSGDPRDTVGRDFFVVDDDDEEHFNPRPKLFSYPYDRLEGNDIHGTPCAGIAVAVVAGQGPCGVAPVCRLLAVKVLHGDQLAPDARVAEAIRYAATQADVISCSWTAPQTPDIELAIDDAGVLGRGGKGAVVVCAAGNDHGQPVGFPASYAAAIGVGATTDKGKLASYSNIGPEIAVVAPSSGGVASIFTTDVSTPGRGFTPRGLYTDSFGGTSAATPLVAGVAALVLSVNPDLTRDQVRSILTKTAVKIDTGYDENGHSPRFGYGRVDAAAAVHMARELHTRS